MAYAEFSSASLAEPLKTKSSASSPPVKSPLLPSARYILVIVGRQKGTESKARLPDNVTLAKTLQLPHLEDEDNSICLRNIMVVHRMTPNIKQTASRTE